MSKSNKWSLCLICNRKAKYGKSICARSNCFAIWRYLDHPKTREDLGYTLKFEVTKTKMRYSLPEPISSQANVECSHFYCQCGPNE
jgi:hypothetical protein